MVNTFQDVAGLDFQTARDEVDFDFSREDLISENNKVHANRDLLVRTEDRKSIGVVSKNRPVLEYGQVMDWVTGEFNKSGMNYKLRESAITAKGDMYQEYLFDMPVPNPDGNEISPLAIVRSSYTGVPLEILLGTYRFVCMNGVVSGETVGRIHVSARNGGEFLESSIRDDLAYKFNQFQKIGDRYQDLAAQSFTPILIEFLSSDILPMLMKKNVMYMMQEDGNLQLTVEKLKSEHLQGAVDELYSVVKEQTAWYLYNTMTQYATHNARSVNSRIGQYKAISQFFGI